MKKLISLLLCINLLTLPAFCEIRDDFTENSLSKDLTIKKAKTTNITDNFVEASLDKNLKTKQISYKLIRDNFAESNKSKNIAIKKSEIPDEKLPSVLKKTAKKHVTLDESTGEKIRIRISKDFTTKTKIDEGDYIEFETLDEVKISNKTYPRRSVVKARVETISQNEIMGVPSDLVIGNFMLDKIPLSGEIKKVGANRTLWVRPLSIILLPMWGAGLLFIPIRGGHAKITPAETFTLYVNK